MKKFFVSVVFSLCCVGMVQASSGKRDRSLSPSTREVLGAHYQNKLSKAPAAYPSVLNVATNSAFSNSETVQSPIVQEVVSAFTSKKYNKAMNLVAQVVKGENVSPDLVGELGRSIAALYIHNEMTEGSPVAINAINAMEAQLRSVSRNK